MGKVLIIVSKLFGVAIKSTVSQSERQGKDVECCE